MRGSIKFFWTTQIPCSKPKQEKGPPMRDRAALRALAEFPKHSSAVLVSPTMNQMSLAEMEKKRILGILQNQDQLLALTLSPEIKATLKRSSLSVEDVKHYLRQKLCHRLP